MTDVVIQNVCDENVPEASAFVGWAIAALAGRSDEMEMTIRLVSPEEMQSLNRTYRGKDALTNVLSFPADEVVRAMHGLLGDVVICPDVVESEARAQNKRRDDHYAHLTVHGVLHLLGYDHIDDREADEMENLETQLLATLGIDNPYSATY
ncbi:MAG: rRNA maturation RNase YbeY [Pseudomonadota bacterium]